ncbi:hypothetical protein P4S64_13875 [Vibrio sp. M60_M31a]
MILIWPMFELISHENPWMMLLGFIISNPIIQAVMYGPWALLSARSLLLVLVSRQVVVNVSINFTDRCWLCMRYRSGLT